MSKIDHRNVTCPECGATALVDIYSSVRAENAELKRGILAAGSLFMHQCSSCGLKIILEYPVLYLDRDKNLAIWFSSKGVTGDLEEALDEFGFMMSSLYSHKRVVYTLNKFIETIKVFDYDLNDLPLFILKIGLVEDTGVAAEDIYFSSLQRRAGGSTISFEIPSLGKTVTHDIILQNLEENVANWDEMDDDLDWVNVNERTFFELFSEFSNRYR